MGAWPIGRNDPKYKKYSERVRQMQAVQKIGRERRQKVRESLTLVEYERLLVDLSGKSLLTTDEIEGFSEGSLDWHDFKDQE